MHCTTCQAQLPEGFGVITCTNCGAIFSVDIDGNLESFDVALPVETQVAIEDASPSKEEEFQDLMSIELSPEPQPEANLVSEQEPVSEVPTEPEPKEALKLGNLLSDVGSSPPLVFRIEILKLDHKDIQTRVLTFLSDSRLALEASEIKKMILNGKVVLDKVNPLIAREIILGLRDSSAEIRWSSRVN